MFNCYKKEFATAIFSQKKICYESLQKATSFYFRMFFVLFSHHLFSVPFSYIACLREKKNLVLLGGIAMNELKPPKVSHQLGNGEYGQIFALEKSNKLVSKRMKWEQDEGIPYFVLREMASLTKLKQCPQISQLHDYFLSITIPKQGSRTCEIDIILKRYKCDLKSKKQMSLQKVKKTLFQLLLALRFAEKHGIVHRDVKLDNIFCDYYGKVVLGDWGLSRHLDANQTGILSGNVQTLWYRSAELLLGAPEYGTSVDVWSVGCVMFALIENRHLFPSEYCNISQLFTIFSKLGTPTSEYYLTQLPHFRPEVFPKFQTNQIQLTRDTSTEAFQLLNSMLALNPQDRPNFDTCLKHAYFDEVRNKFKETIFVAPVDNTPTVSVVGTRDRMQTFDWMFTTLDSIFPRISLQSGRVYYEPQQLNYHSSENCGIINVFFLACQYFDSYTLDEEFDLKLMGAACLLTASKMLSSDLYLSINQLVSHLNHREKYQYTVNDVSNYEIVLVHTLKFDLYKTGLFNLVRNLQTDRGVPKCKLSAALVYLLNQQSKNTTNDVAQMIVEYSSGKIHPDLELFDSVAINRAMYILEKAKMDQDLKFGTLKRFDC
jgi:serine/threonine protein kinase